MFDNRNNLYAKRMYYLKELTFPAMEQRLTESWKPLLNTIKEVLLLLVEERLFFGARRIPRLEKYAKGSAE